MSRRSKPPADAPAVDSAAAPPAIGWSPLVRAGVSLLLLLHLTLVVCVPMSMVRPASPLASTFVGWFQPYIEAGNISHGYAFFAPNPGEYSHLVRYQLEFDDDRPTITGQMPSLEEQWPRLLYHRHFMLTERLGGMANNLEEMIAAAAPAEEIDLARRQLLDMATSYALQLQNEHEADRVSIELVRHMVPSIEDVREGQELDDESLYEPYRISPLARVGEGWLAPLPELIAPPEITAEPEIVVQPEPIEVELVPAEEVP